jgi:hypothetical protein
VSLGGVTVRLRNKANVCEAFLDDIFSKSGLDNRELLLMLEDKNGYGYGTNGLRASATSSCAFDQNLFKSGNDPVTNVTTTWETVPCRRDIELIDLVQLAEWDAVVCVPKITTDRWKNYKPYFAFVLGHELEHVKVIRENLKFHMCATRLLDWKDAIFVKAGIDYKSKKNWNFPLEIHCDKKGKKLAIDLLGQEEFDKCLVAMRDDKNETQEHKEYLASIKDELEGEPHADNICESICRDIRAYYNDRNLKEAAHEIWREKRSDGDKIAAQFNLEELI